MKFWKIHLCWALVAMATAGAWGQHSLSQRESALRSREAAVRIPHAALLGELPASSAVPGTIPLPAEVQGRPSAKPRFMLPPDPQRLPVAEIRRLMKSDRAEDLERLLVGIDKLDDPSLRRQLRLELLRCVAPYMKVHVLNAIRHEIDEQYLPILQDSLRSAPEPSARRRAAELLGQLPDRGSTELLVNAYQEDDPKLKLSVAAALYRLGRPGEAVDLLPRLAAGLESPDGSERREAVREIGRLKAPIAIPVLTRALGDSYGDVRSEAAAALSEIDVPEVPPLLEPLLKDPNTDVRDAVQEALNSYRKRHAK